MKILLTGASGYIGSRLLPFLVEKGHQVYCLVRNKENFLKTVYGFLQKKIHIIELDLIQKPFSTKIHFQAAYFLIHSMGEIGTSFQEKDKLIAKNFIASLAKPPEQIIYLSGLVTSHKLSPHLESRQKVENILCSSLIPVTTLRAGIVIGSSSASFEIIRDLCETLPVMVAPKWVKSLCQPISIDDALYYLLAVLGNKQCYHRTFDIGGPDILTYKDMLQGYAKTRKLCRIILPIPVLTPQLSSYWLYFITSTNFSLAMSLIESVKNNAICIDKSILSIIPHKCLSYHESLKKALQPFRQTCFFKNLQEAETLIKKKPYLIELLTSPHHGCYTLTEQKKTFIKNLNTIKTKGQIIKKTATECIIYQKKNKEYWLSFQLKKHVLSLTLIHRPKGVWQRLYWKLSFPLKKKRLQNMLLSTHQKNTSQ